MECRRNYKEELKIGIVSEIESGVMTIREAARATGAGVNHVHKWLEEYGRFKPKKDIVEVVMKSEQEKIRELEKALSDAHLKLVVYEEIINLAGKKYKTDLKKSFGSGASEVSAREPFISSKISAKR